ncbi:MAG: HAMP domain-containing histidine kinase [bacterium]|nr:HAMP domain-containing histidine kinase [bacterium]
MDGPAAEPHDALERDAEFRAHTCEPAVAMCRDDEIVWASPALAELLGAGAAPTLMGKRLEAVLLEWGEPTDVAGTYRTVDPARGAALTVCVDRVTLPEDSQGGAWHEMELCILSDRSYESEVLARARELDHDRDQVENVRKEIKQDRDELIALLSHELRTPLTVISGYSKLLLSERAGSLSDEQRRYLDASRESCERLNGFVVDLLDVSHDHGGAICLRLELLAIEDSIRSVIEFFSPLFEEKDLDVEIDLSEDLPKAHFDSTRIEQVLTNLLGNAVKYSKAGSVIRVSARVVDGEASPAIEVSIRDEGPGIAAEDAERIFEPYVRGRRDGREGGVGLGLAICRRILDAHRGNIGVEAVPGRGSCFHFSIPARDAGSRMGC